MNKYRRLSLLLVLIAVSIVYSNIASNVEVLAQQNQSQACIQSYVGVCIAPPPPDLNCADIPYKNIRINGSDPHGFDGNDNDGIGCES